MKKLIAALLLLVLAFTCFVACGDETTVTLDDAKTYLQNMLNADDGKETPRDYNVVAKVMIEGVTFDVTWTTDNDKIQVTESDKASFWKIDVPESNDTAFSYKITATIKDADGESVQISFNRKLPVYDNAGIVTDLQENTAYRFFMYQANKQNYYFALAEIDSQGKYYETTTTAADAADFYAEKSGEGYKFYTLIDGTKNYVDAYTVVDESNGKISKRLQFSTEGDVWTYNGETNGWYTTIDGTSYVIGTYGTFTTFSISESTYLSKENSGVSQFPAGFMTPAYAESLKPSEGPTIYTTPEEIVNAAYALEKGAMLSGGHKYTLTGVITEVNTPYDSGYGNVTVTIVVNGMTDKPIECFRLEGDGADVIAVGDEITVTGEILKYDNQSENGKVEFNSGCTLDAYPGSGSVTPNPDTPSDKTYGVVTELKTGDQVLIGAPAYGKLLSALKVNADSFYNKGVDYSATNFANVTDDEIFTVTVNDDGTYTFTSLTGVVIALADQYSSLNAEGANKYWTLEAKEGATGIFYMKNTGREGYYLEWYASKDNWSTFNGTLSDLFEISFYAIGGTVTPDDGGDETPDDGGDDNTQTPDDGGDTTLTTPEEILNAAYALNDGESINGPFTLTGVITTLDSYNNPTIVIGDFTTQPIYCYKLKDDSFVVGATITVTAQSIKNYGGTIEMMDCTLDNIVLPGAGDNTQTPDDGGDNTDTPTETTPVQPTVEGKYNAYVNAEALGGIVYLTGKTENSAWYLATSANVADAAVVYVEDVTGVEGAYYLYFMDGETKTYIEAYERTAGDAGYGKGSIQLVQTTPTSYYTYDETYNTLIVTSADGLNKYYIGTYTNSKDGTTYNTLSCSNYSYLSADNVGVTQFPMYFAVATEVTPDQGGETTPSTITVTEAISIAGTLDGNNRETTTETYTITGVITSITQTTYGNMMIKGEDGASILVYGVKDADGNNYGDFANKPAVGDTITVTGNVQSYYGTPEIINGVLVSYEAHTCNYTDATCTVPATCPLCGATNGTAPGHNYVDGTCTACGGKEPTGDEVVTTASKTIAELITSEGWDGTTTKQSFNLDSNVTVKVDGGNNSGKAYDGNHIRIYATDTPAGTLTISVAEGYELVSIKVTTVEGTYAFLCVEGTDADISNVETAVSGSSVVLNSVKNGSNGKQVRVLAIEVEYKVAA